MGDLEWAWRTGDLDEAWSTGDLLDLSEETTEGLDRQEEEEAELEWAESEDSLCLCSTRRRINCSDFCQD